ncbi:uncharacterized protein LOC110184408 isoform X2 [Drosophila serrata]|uniref:uncharacterized protein LOC110184408 isoform X2 n=1 Tax=Drosophila serrata TaxID=7274 RepID=UPI000A1D1C15|nr:uncharacterized protein LOC110184408 isoform X2 [Drosophila serrata]
MLHFGIIFLSQTQLAARMIVGSVSAVPEDEIPPPSFEEMAKELGIDLNMDDFNLDLDLGLDLGLDLDLDLDIDMDFDKEFDLDMPEISEMPKDGSMDIDDFAFVDSMVKFFINESKALAWYIVRLTERQLLKIFMYPYRQLQLLAGDIEKRAVESEECVARETVHVAGVLERATLGFVVCGRNAAVNSVKIVLDTKRSVLQLTLNGYRIIKQYKNCKGISNNVRYRMCRSKLYLMATKYVVGAQKSVRHLIGLRRSVPAIATDATACTTQATDNAIQGFADINASIDRCIDTMLN